MTGLRALFAGAGHGGKPPCQDTKFAAAASTGETPSASLTSAAVRGRSACSLPRSSIPDPLGRTPLSSCSCTPAQWDAINLAGHRRSPIGSGEAVLARTVREPGENHQSIEIITLSAPVLRFSVFASRDARVYAHARTRMYMCARNTRTREPDEIINSYQKVNGSGAVLERFSPEPALRSAVSSGGKLREINKIGRGYALSGLRTSLIGSNEGREGGRVAKSFGAGISGAAGGSAWRRSSSRGSMRSHLGCGRNGGFLRVCEGRAGRVGTGMLEQVRRNGGNASFAECRRKLCRLTAGLRGGSIEAALGSAAGDRRRGGGGPPSAARPVPCPFAQAIFQISDRDAIACHDGRPAEGANGRHGSGGPTGSGEVVAGPSARERRAGRGVFAGLEGRRSGQPSGGAAHVN